MLNIQYYMNINWYFLIHMVAKFCVLLNIVYNCMLFPFQIFLWKNFKHNL